MPGSFDRPISRALFGAALLASALAAFVSAQSARVDVLDPHKLPLGDGRVSTAPRSGYVLSCQQFGGAGAPAPPMGPRRGGPPGARSRGPGGAQVDGPWIHGDTWDLTQKISVRGRVAWPDAQFRITTSTTGRDVTRIAAGNGLPVDTPTGTFPVQQDDPAFQIDRNPNSIRAQSVAWTLPRDPVAAAQPSCVPMGPIGIALNGVAIFNALDAGGRDAVAHEVQDLCSGHPEMRGTYHYHGPSPCLPNQTGAETLIGYALDGFGIFSLYDAHGRELTNADLDACHGRVSEIQWDGARVSMYHYVLTREYPYTVGCFRGTPIVGGRTAGRP